MLTGKSTNGTLLFGNVSYIKLKIKLRINIEAFGSVEKHWPDGYLKSFKYKAT